MIMRIEMFIGKFMANKINKNIKNNIICYLKKIKINNNKNIYYTIRMILPIYVRKFIEKFKNTFYVCFPLLNYLIKNRKNQLKAQKNFEYLLIVLINFKELKKKKLPF
jgi:hypothetical protein